MRVLVTGGGGFIGACVAWRFSGDEGRCHEVVSARSCDEKLPLLKMPFRELACDITNKEEVRSLLGCYQPDVICHLAAIPTVKEDIAHPCRITEVNVLGTHYLLQYAPRGCRFLLASSATVYGNQTSVESRAHENDQLHPNSVYGATKIAAEALVEAYTSQHRVLGMSLRLVATVGAGANHGLIPDIIRKLQSDAPNLHLLGDAPGSCKPYLYVDDAAEAFYYFATLTYPVPGPANICPRDSLTVEEVATIVMEETGIRKPIVWEGEQANWPGDNRQVHVSPRVAAQLHFRLRYDYSRDAVREAVRDILE